MDGSCTTHIYTYIKYVKHTDSHGHTTSTSTEHREVSVTTEASQPLYIVVTTSPRAEQEVVVFTANCGERMDADVHEKYAVCVHSDGQLRHSSLRTSR